MQIFEQFPSLRPHLNYGQGTCCLQISLISDNQEQLERSKFPFLEATQSDPLHRLIKGKFITGANSRIQEVFLLVQRDNYLLKKDELWPITNSTIEQSWQRALLNHWQGKSSIFLVDPVKERNELNPPWEPLFYCKKQKSFFPVLCPQCGLTLQLCREDDLLAELNLPNFSQSLERYLYCPSCFKQGKREFFTYASKNGDPHYVKNRFALLNDLANLFAVELAEDLFPCKECRRQGECFGAKNLIQVRVTPLSFYPFYMLIFKAVSLNAQEFVSLLGGAKDKELQEDLQLKQEWGRRESLKSYFQDKDQQPNHLFVNQDNFFGEVLFLKLTFLQAVLQKLLAGNNFFSHPELRLSLDRIWVDLPSTPGLLPTFWNFQVEIMDTPELFFPSLLPNPPQTEVFYFFGQLWFYTLLVNKKQNLSQVYTALEKTGRVISDAESFSFTDFSPVFWPQNIYWHPNGQKVPSPFMPFWEESLKLGWSLLMFCLQRKTTLSPETLLDKLVKLTEKIKDHLFQLKISEEKPAYIGEDAIIRGILKKLLTEWTQAEHLPAAETTETVILTPGQIKKEVRSPTVAQDTPETVIISKEDRAQTRPSAAPDLAEEEAIETVILRPEAKTPERPIISSIRPEDEEVAQTVILKPQAPPPDDLGAEKVIITPAFKLASEKKKSYAEKVTKEEIPEIAPAEREEKEEIKEDLLSETVIIQPKRTSEKGRYGGKK